MALGEIGKIRLGCHACEFGEDDVADAVGRDPEPLEAVGHESLRQLGVPAGAVDRMLEPGSPLTGAQPRVPGYLPSRPRMAVKVERVRDHEAGQIPSQQSIWAGVLPIDDTPDPSVAYQEVAGPEVSVHDTARPCVRPIEHGGPTDVQGQRPCPGPRRIGA